MPKVYGSITISDIADVGRLSVYLTNCRTKLCYKR